MYIYIYFSESASMSVKEILQSLVDDAMVDTDKIGDVSLLLGLSQQGVAHGKPGVGGLVLGHSTWAGNYAQSLGFGWFFPMSCQSPAHVLCKISLSLHYLRPLSSTVPVLRASDLESSNPSLIPEGQVSNFFSIFSS